MIRYEVCLPGPDRADDSCKPCSICGIPCIIYEYYLVWPNNNNSFVSPMGWCCSESCTTFFILSNME